MTRVFYCFLIALLGLTVLNSCNTTGRLVLDDDDDDASDDDDSVVDDDDDASDDDDVADDDDDDTVGTHPWEGDYAGYFGIFRETPDGARPICTGKMGFAVDAEGTMDGGGDCYAEGVDGWDGDEEGDHLSLLDITVDVEGTVDYESFFEGTVILSSEFIGEVEAWAEGMLDAENPGKNWEGWYFSWEVELPLGWNGADRLFYGLAWSQ
jgi:hypothetical protein